MSPAKNVVVSCVLHTKARYCLWANTIEQIIGFHKIEIRVQPWNFLVSHMTAEHKRTHEKLFKNDPQVIKKLSKSTPKVITK